MEVCCDICFVSFSQEENRIAKVIPDCGHTFCLECLEGYVRIRSSFYCPFNCFKSVNPPLSMSPANLKTNKIVMDIVKGGFREAKCKNCLYPFDLRIRIPLLLRTCGHTFCKLCVYSCLYRNKDKKELYCPIGDKTVSSTGEEVIKNISVTKLIEELSRVERPCG